jgi:hypothetical protein
MTKAEKRNDEGRTKESFHGTKFSVREEKGKEEKRKTGEQRCDDAKFALSCISQRWGGSCTAAPGSHGVQT